MDLLLRATDRLENRVLLVLDLVAFVDNKKKDGITRRML